MIHAGAGWAVEQLLQGQFCISQEKLLFLLSPFWALPLTYNGLSVSPSLLCSCITRSPDSFCGEFSGWGVGSVSSLCLPWLLGGKSFPLGISAGSGAALLGSWSSGAGTPHSWDGGRWSEVAPQHKSDVGFQRLIFCLLCDVFRRELLPCGLPAAGCWMKSWVQEQCVASRQPLGEGLAPSGSHQAQDSQHIQLLLQPAPTSSAKPVDSPSQFSGKKWVHFLLHCIFTPLNSSGAYWEMSVCSQKPEADLVRVGGSASFWGHRKLLSGLEVTKSDGHYSVTHWIWAGLKITGLWFVRYMC